MDAYRCAYRDPKSPLTPIKPMSESAFQFNDELLQKNKYSSKHQSVLMKSPKRTVQITIPKINFTNTSSLCSSESSYNKSPETTHTILKNGDSNKENKSPIHDRSATYIHVSRSPVKTREWIILHSKTPEKSEKSEKTPSKNTLSPTSTPFISFQASKKSPDGKRDISPQRTSPTYRHHGACQKSVSSSASSCSTKQYCQKHASPSHSPTCKSPCKHLKSPTCQCSNSKTYLYPSSCSANHSSRSPTSSKVSSINKTKSPTTSQSQSNSKIHKTPTGISKSTLQSNFGADLSTKNSTNYPKSAEIKKCLVTNTKPCPKSCPPKHSSQKSSLKSSLSTQENSKTPLSSKISQIHIIRTNSQYSKVSTNSYKIIKERHQQIEININPKQNYKRTSPIAPKKLCPCVAKILNDSGMDKYSNLFENEEIDFDIFKMLKDNDLRQIGLAAEKDRERILNAIHFCDNSF